MSACPVIRPISTVFRNVPLSVACPYVQPLKRTAVLGMEMCYWNFSEEEGWGGILIIKLICK